MVSCSDQINFLLDLRELLKKHNAYITADRMGQVNLNIGTSEIASFDSYCDSDTVKSKINQEFGRG